MKDHEISILINRLVEIAKLYHNTQQLREQIAGIVVPALKEKRSSHESINNRTN